MEEVAGVSYPVKHKNRFILEEVAGVSYPVKHKNRFILNFNNSGYG
jgi:hypothetical protein